MKRVVVFIRCAHWRSYALKLHGEHDSVEITPAPQLDVTEEYTICAWVYLEAFGYGARIVDKAVEGQISACAPLLLC